MFGCGREERPNDSRLVLIYMSKQMAVEDVLPEALVPRARALYLQMLRDAASLNGTPELTPSRKPSKPGLFRSQSVTASLNSSATSATASHSSSGDVVQMEAQRWSALPQEVIQACDPGGGVINEFDLIYSVRQEFPLHYTLFRQIATHIAHEANSESTFSEAGGLTHHRMNADFLSLLVRINGNKATCKPAWEDIYEEYKIRFGKLTAEEERALAQMCEGEDSSESEVEDAECEEIIDVEE